MRTIFLIGLLTVATGLSGCGKPNFQPETASAVEVASELPAPGPLDATTKLRSFAVGPGDILAISVLGLTDLDRKIQVDERGSITYPLVGRLEVLGHTPQQIEALLAERLGERYLRNPQVSVLVTENLSQRVVVGGAVRQPGLYPVTNSATLSQAIAQASGLSDIARPNEVVLFRTVGAKRYAARYSLADIYGGRAEDPQIYANDRIVVGNNENRGLLRDLAPLTPLLGIFYNIL